MLVASSIYREQAYIYFVARVNQSNQLREIGQ